MNSRIVSLLSNLSNSMKVTSKKSKIKLKDNTTLMGGLLWFVYAISSVF